MSVQSAFISDYKKISPVVSNLILGNETIAVLFTGGQFLYCPPTKEYLSFFLGEDGHFGLIHADFARKTAGDCLRVTGTAQRDLNVNTDIHLHFPNGSWDLLQPIMVRHDLEVRPRFDKEIEYMQKDGAVRTQKQVKDLDFKAKLEALQIATVDIAGAYAACVAIEQGKSGAEILRDAKTAQAAFALLQGVAAAKGASFTPHIDAPSPMNVSRVTRTNQSNGQAPHRSPSPATVARAVNNNPHGFSLNMPQGNPIRIGSRQFTSHRVSKVNVVVEQSSNAQIRAKAEETLRFLESIHGPA
ncbi:MAG: hypothetical protein AAFY24_09765 [Pseudomonadota bacterium]